MDKFDDDFSGGMYNMLKLLDKILFKSNDKKFKTNEIILFCPNVSKCAVTNNITRLVKIGYLEKIESRDHNNNNCRVVEYKLKGEKIDEIRKSLYN